MSIHWYGKINTFCVINIMHSYFILSYLLNHFHHENLFISFHNTNYDSTECDITACVTSLGIPYFSFFSILWSARVWWTCRSKIRVNSTLLSSARTEAKCSVSTYYSIFCSIKAVIYCSREHCPKQHITVVLPLELKKIVVWYCRVSTAY